MPNNTRADITWHHRGVIWNSIHCSLLLLTTRDRVQSLSRSENGKNKLFKLVVRWLINTLTFFSFNNVYNNINSWIGLIHTGGCWRWLLAQTKVLTTSSTFNLIWCRKRLNKQRQNCRYRYGSEEKFPFLSESYDHSEIIVSGFVG